MKYSNKVDVKGEEKLFGVLVGIITTEPKLLIGREVKKDVGYFSVANNFANPTVFYQVTVYDADVKKCEKLSKRALVAIKGEFETGDNNGKAVETLSAQAIEIL